MSVIEDARAEGPPSATVVISRRRAGAPATPAAPAPQRRHGTSARQATDPEAIERHHILLGVSDVAVARAYKILRTRALHRLLGTNWRSEGNTGTVAGEGKSLAAINLACGSACEVNTWGIPRRSRLGARRWVATWA